MKRTTRQRTTTTTIFTLYLLLDWWILPRGSCDLLLGETTATDVTIGPGLGGPGFSRGYEAPFGYNGDSSTRSGDHRRPEVGFYRGNEDNREATERRRNNEKRSESKWRDVDAVPSFPFSHFARTNSAKESTESPRSVKQLPLRDDYADYALIPERSTRRRTSKHDVPPQVQKGPNEYEYELENEEYLKPRPRKRRPPQFVPSYTRENEFREMTTADASLRKKNEALKSLLKMQQEEGSSLSEVLRRKNLTLIDLLRGQTELIDVLRMEDVDETGEDIEQMAAIVMSNISFDKVAPKRTFGNRVENVSSKNADEVLIPVEKTDTLTTVMPMLENSVEFRSIEQADINDTTVPLMTTLSSIAENLPSSQIGDEERNKDFNESTENSAQDATRELDEDEIMEFSDFMDYKKHGSSTVSPMWLSVPTVGHKNNESLFLHVSPEEGGSSGKSSVVQILNANESISLESDDGWSEIFLSNYSLPNDTSSVSVHKEDSEPFSEEEYQKDVPMTAENDKYVTVPPPSSPSHSPPLFSSSSIPTTESLQWPVFKNTQKSLKNQENMQKSKKYEEILSEIEPEARAEIFELFSSGSSGERLERLLKSRNMSLEELIALRQRGSSKVHLVEVSRLRKQQNSLESSITSGTKNNETTVSNKITNTNEDTTISLFDATIQRIEEVPSTADKNLQQPANKTEQEIVTGTVEITDLLTTFASLPFSKDLKNEFNFEKHPKHQFVDQLLPESVDTDQTTSLIPRSNNIQTILLEEVREEKSMNNLNQIEIEDEQRESFSKLIPSIIASGAILGVTVVVFLTIFVVCRVRQKQKYRYRNAFSRAVFQGPVTAARKLSNSSSLSNVMVNVVATSTTRRLEKNDVQEADKEFDQKSDMDNDSLDANDSWETIPDYMK